MAVRVRQPPANFIPDAAATFAAIVEGQRAAIPYEILPAETVQGLQNINRLRGEAMDRAGISGPIQALPETVEMIQLGASNFLAGGDFSGGLPGSSGGSGSAIIDLIGKGIDLTSTIVASRAGNRLQGSDIMVETSPERIRQAAKNSPLGPLIDSITGRTAANDPVLAIQKALNARTGKVKRYRKDGSLIRRTNPLNPRALRRSMRRVNSFAKFAKKTITFTQRVRMKKRRR